MNNKPKRNFRWQKSNNARYIQSSSSGLFFTVDGDDKRAVREAYNLLDSFIPKEIDEKLNLEKSEEKPKKCEDVSDLLTKMCAETVGTKGQQNNKRFFALKFKLQLLYFIYELFEII